MEVLSVRLLVERVFDSDDDVDDVNTSLSFAISSENGKI